MPDPSATAPARDGSHGLRVAAAIVGSAAMLAVSAATFWYQDWQYSLPTPRPADLTQADVGAPLDLTSALGHPARGPVAIHVVSPDCPCSRFNRDHLRTLVRRFGHAVRFVALVQGDGDADALVRAFRDWGVPIEAIADPGGRRALALGAYSTPQAVIADARGALYYRGNYNSTRYHVDQRTEYARIALEALAADRPAPRFGADATTAWGCPLPRRPRVDPAAG